MGGCDNEWESVTMDGRPQQWMGGRDNGWAMGGHDNGWAAVTIDGQP